MQKGHCFQVETMYNAAVFSSMCRVENLHVVPILMLSTVIPKKGMFSQGTKFGKQLTAIDIEIRLIVHRSSFGLVSEE